MPARRRSTSNRSVDPLGTALATAAGLLLLRFLLPAVAPYLLELAEHGTADPSGHVRLRARLLRRAVADFGATTASGFHGMAGATTEELLHAYARDHLGPSAVRR